VDGHAASVSLLRRPFGTRIVNTRPDQSELVGLVQPGSHGPLATYLSRIWERKAYVWYVASNELRSQQLNTVLGNLWHVLNPMLQIGIYALIFGFILEIDRGIDNYLAFLAVGVFAYSYTQKTITSGVGSLAKNQGLMRSISFPRAMLPMASTLTELLTFVPKIGVMLVTVLATGEPALWTWLLIVPIAFVQTVFGLGFALITARAGAHADDFKNLLPFVFRLLFYASGVLFTIDRFVTPDSSLRWIFFLNPVYDVLALYRWAVLGYELKAAYLISLAVWTVGGVVIGTWWFRRGEATYGL